MTHIIVDADKVLAQALEVKQQILDYRNKRDERAIAKAMTKKKHFWSKATLTREEAIAFLDSNDEFGWRSERGWGDLQVVERLITTAKHGDPVYLDSKDAHTLWRTE